VEETLVEGRIDWVVAPEFHFGFSFVLHFSCHSSCLFSFAGWLFHSELILHVMDIGWDLGDTR
jgi:hypothetical protein